MLTEMKTLLSENFGREWLNNIHNQNGLSEDLSILDKDITRVSRKYGLMSRGLELTEDVEIIARYEVIMPINSLFDIDSVFYSWWGCRAAENFSYIQREIADDEVIYHFITGSASHGHSGRIILTGSNVKQVLRSRLDRRLQSVPVANTEDYAEVSGYAQFER